MRRAAATPTLFWVALGTQSPECRTGADYAGTGGLRGSVMLSAATLPPTAPAARLGARRGLACSAMISPVKSAWRVPMMP